MNGNLQMLRLEVGRDRAAFTARLDELQVAIDPSRLAGVRDRALHGRPAVEADLLTFEAWLQRMAERT